MNLPIEATRVRLVDRPTQVGVEPNKMVVRPGTVVVDVSRGALVIFPRHEFEALFPTAKLDPNTREYTIPAAKKKAAAKKTEES